MRSGSFFGSTAILYGTAFPPGCPDDIPVKPIPWVPRVEPDPVPVPPLDPEVSRAFLEGLVLFVILWWFSASKRPRRAVSGMFLLFYGIFRFGVEFVREPDEHIGFVAMEWLTMGHLLSAPMILFGVLLLVLAYRHKEVKGETVS